MNQETYTRNKEEVRIFYISMYHDFKVIIREYNSNITLKGGWMVKQLPLRLPKHFSCKLLPGKDKNPSVFLFKRFIQFKMGTTFQPF